MDWSLVISTFTLILLAEMGDKTQLAALSLTRRPVAIATGAIGALCVGTIFAVFAGQVLPEVVPTVWIRRGAGALFLLTGIRLLTSGG
jgi:putative Ca2+/H+ antiporter (TMEM165/GDT1 family)